MAPRWIGALAAALLLATSCSGGDPVGPPEGFDRASTQIVNPSAARGGTLRLVYGEIDSLDPAQSRQSGMWNVMRLYTRQLVTYAPSPGDAGTGLVPDLATSLGQPNDDGTVWTYTLKPGLKFETGDPITSHDLKYGIERLFADPQTGGPGWVTALLAPDHPYTGPSGDATLDTVVTPDDLTIEFHLNRPFADWDYVMALPASTPVPNGHPPGPLPLSSGPYRIQDQNDQTVTFVRNENWSRDTDTVRRALPDQVELTTGVAPDDRDRLIMSGEADADVTGSGLGAAAASRVLGDRSLYARAADPTTGTLWMLALPVDQAPFDNQHCRRAIQYAVDKADVKESLGGPAAAALATTLWPRGMSGYPATVPYPDGEGNHGDLDQARAELDQCGHPDGFDTIIAAPDSGRGEPTARAVRDALARVGINTEVSTFSREDFLAEVRSPDRVRQDGIGIIVYSWSADFPVPSAFYRPLTGPVTEVNNTNVADLDDDELSGDRDRAAGSLDRGIALTAWQRYDAAVMATGAYVPLVEDRVLILGSERLRNVYVHPAYAGYDVVSLGVA